MTLRLAIAVAAAIVVFVAYLRWRRPPRLEGLDLPALGLEGPAVVQFSTAWCAPCKAAAPRLRATAEAEQIAFADLDVGERPDIARRYGIRSVPTIVVVGRSGRVLGTWIGLPGDGVVARAARAARRA